MQLLHGMIGASIAGIPLVLLLLVQINSCAAVCQQINYYEKWEQNGLYLYVWTLKRDIAAGEKITREDLEQQKAWVPETDYPEKSISLGQITGKKAKKAITKGTLIHADLLADKKKSKNAAKK